MAKKIQAYVKLQIAAGAANPSPPVGPALGQQGVNIMQFCKEFNAATQEKEKGEPTPVVITVYSDKSFTFITKSPPASYLIKKMAGLKSGSAKPHTDFVGEITVKQLEEIVEKKKDVLTAKGLEAAIDTLKGTAASMGIKVVEA